MNLYSGIKYNVYKKAVITDTPESIKAGKTVRFENGADVDEFLQINDEDKLVVVALPKRGITPEIISSFTEKSSFIIEEGLCLEPGTISLQSKSKSGYYLSVKDDGYALEKVDPANGCSKWNTCFIAQEEEGDDFKDKTNPIVLESAISPNFYLTYDGTTLARSGKPDQTTDDHEEKTAAWNKSKVWSLIEAV